jgi:hypothetical protein
MTDVFTKNFAIAVVLIPGLLVLAPIPDLMGHTENRRRLAKIVGEMKNGDLNREGVRLAQDF